MPSRKPKSLLSGRIAFLLFSLGAESVFLGRDFFPCMHFSAAAKKQPEFLAALFTGIGIFDRIARIAGAGTLVPITGFANAMASPAIDAKAEGWILGVGAKTFNVAGPVILYGTLASVLYGVIYYIVGLF